MKGHLIIVCFSLLYTNSILGQIQNSKTGGRLGTFSIKKTSINTVPLNLGTGKDSVVVSIPQLDQITKLYKIDDGLIKEIFPSLIAVVVVLISTLGAVYIGKKQMSIQIKSNEEQLRSQEAQSQERLKVSREQIQEAYKITLKQINSNNQQNWVNETRNVVSELMTQANLLNIEFQEQKINIDKKKNIHEKLTFNKNRLFLLLNPDKENHKLLLASLNNLMTTLDIHLLNSKSNNDTSSEIGFIPYDNGKFMMETDTIIEKARNLLYEEWEKI